MQWPFTRPMPGRFQFRDETPIEAAADILVGAKAEGSAIGTFRGIQLQASLRSTAEAIVADYKQRATSPDRPPPGHTMK